MPALPTTITGRSTVTIEQNFEFANDLEGFTPCTVVAVSQMTGGKLHDPLLVSASFIPPGGQHAIDDWARRELGLPAMRSLFKPENSLPPPMERAQRLAIIAEILSFAMNFQRGEESDASYINGLVETSGHIAACCLCQWMNLTDGVGTAETVEALELYKMPELPRIRELLDAYLKELEEHQGVEERPRGRHAEHCASITHPGSEAACDCNGGDYVASGRGPRQLGAYDG